MSLLTRSFYQAFYAPYRLRVCNDDTTMMKIVTISLNNINIAKHSVKVSFFEIYQKSFSIVKMSQAQRIGHSNMPESTDKSCITHVWKQNNTPSDIKSSHKKLPFRQKTHHSSHPLTLENKGFHCRNIYAFTKDSHTCFQIKM